MDRTQNWNQLTDKADLVPAEQQLQSKIPAVLTHMSYQKTSYSPT